MMLCVKFEDKGIIDFSIIPHPTIDAKKQEK
jgi:hypothetical protein